MKKIIKRKKRKSKQKKNLPLIIAVSSSALFDLSESDMVYRKKGVEAYAKYQRKNEKVCLSPGYAFKLIKKILDINSKIVKRFKLSDPAIEVILLSRNTGDTGLRVFNSINEHGLDITRAAFCGGDNPVVYGKSLNCHLFLSENQDDVEDFIDSGLAAARIYSSPGIDEEHDALHIAFDADAVIFSDESEAIYETEGIDRFHKNEANLAKKPLNPGPFKSFLQALSDIQKLYAGDAEADIKTALFTARSAPAHERVILTLREWGVHLDNCVFMGGQEKGPLIKAFKADIFFDDKKENIESASKNHVDSGHVPRARS